MKIRGQTIVILWILLLYKILVCFKIWCQAFSLPIHQFNVKWNIFDLNIFSHHDSWISLWLLMWAFGRWCESEYKRFTYQEDENFIDWNSLEPVILSGMQESTAALGIVDHKEIFVLVHSYYNEFHKPLCLSFYLLR